MNEPLGYSEEGGNKIVLARFSVREDLEVIG